MMFLGTILTVGCGTAKVGNTTDIENNVQEVKVTDDLESAKLSDILEGDDTDIRESFWSNALHRMASSMDDTEKFYYVSFDKKNRCSVINSVSVKDNVCSPLCQKEECMHNDSSCEAYYDDLNNKCVWRNSDKIYIIRKVNGRDVLYSMDLNGRNEREICIIGENTESSSYEIAFDNENAYIVLRGGTAINTDIKEISIQKVRLDGTDRKNVFSMQGDSMYIDNLKYYGGNIFFNVKKYTENRNIDSLGLYAYNVKNDKTVVISQKNVTDYAIDMTKKEIYMFFADEGLYRQSADGSENAMIFKADDSMLKCQVSFDGDNIYLSNADWISHEKKTDILPQICAVDTDGKKIIAIEDKDISNVYFGNKSGMFILFKGDILKYVDKTDGFKMTEISHS